MHIELLGVLGVSINKAPIVPSAKKTRNLLALLALNAGKLITISKIREELWDGSPPRSASTTLQTYVMQLRNRIARGLTTDGNPDTESARRILVTGANGYLLDVSSGFCDAIEFDRLATQGNRLFDELDYHGAADTLRRALDLWRGPALVDIDVGPVLAKEVVRLEERRRLVTERRLYLDLALGRHHSIVDELSALAALDRTHEGVHGQLMIALYRCRRRAHALDVFQRLRSAMREELGLEPSPWLHRLQRAILGAELDAELDAGDLTEDFKSLVSMR